jgi:hypothetical protein
MISYRNDPGQIFGVMATNPHDHLNGRPAYKAADLDQAERPAGLGFIEPCDCSFG